MLNCPLSFDVSTSFIFPFNKKCYGFKVFFTFRIKRFLYTSSSIVHSPCTIRIVYKVVFQKVPPSLSKAKTGVNLFIIIVYIHEINKHILSLYVYNIYIYIYMYIYIYYYTSLSVYIYIERERDIDIDIYISIIYI